MREPEYHGHLIRKIHTMFPSCIVLKNDSGYLQGIPDLLILNEDRWAALEVKASARASEQPNQNHYVWLMNEMSFAAFIYPEIEEDVLYALQQAL